MTPHSRREILDEMTRDSEDEIRALLSGDHDAALREMGYWGDLID